MSTRRAWATSLSFWVSSVQTRCDSSIQDELFDVRIPKRLQVGFSKQDLFSTAHRCMHDVCWFKPARAYVIALFVDQSALGRLKAQGCASADEIFPVVCPKSFVLFFASTKDSKHIRNGFNKSFSRFQAAKDRIGAESVDSKISDFLSVLDGHRSLKKGDFLRVSCVPLSRTVVVSFNEETGVADQLGSLAVCGSGRRSSLSLHSRRA